MRVLPLPFRGEGRGEGPCGKPVARGSAPFPTSLRSATLPLEGERE
jgi:hypothetical protein